MARKKFRALAYENRHPGENYAISRPFDGFLAGDCAWPFTYLWERD
jgi:hypothetical protein